MKGEILKVNPYINESIGKDFYSKLCDGLFIIIYKNQEYKKQNVIMKILYEEMF